MLAGYTAYNKEGDIVTGTMPTKTINATLSSGGSKTIPAGYYDGSSSNKVTAGALSSETAATATSGEVLNTYTGWKAGSKITGTMANKGAVSSTLSANGTYTVPGGWHNGSGKVTQSLSTQGAKTITPSTSNQTVVDSSKWVTASQIVAGNANLLATNIKKDVTIFGVTGNYVPSTSAVRSTFTRYQVYTVELKNSEGYSLRSHCYHLSPTGQTPLDLSKFNWVWLSGYNEQQNPSGVLWTTYPWVNFGTVSLSVITEPYVFYTTNNAPGWQYNQTSPITTNHASSSFNIVTDYMWQKQLAETGETPARVRYVMYTVGHNSFPDKNDIENRFDYYNYAPVGQVFRDILTWRWEFQSDFMDKYDNGCDPWGGALTYYTRCISPSKYYGLPMSWGYQDHQGVWHSLDKSKKVVLRANINHNILINKEEKEYAYGFLISSIGPYSTKNMEVWFSTTE